MNIMGSQVHLGKTLMNLVTNAAEAMPEGDIISIRTENVYVDRPIAGYDEIREGDYVVLTISDTGIGISVEDREKIFEPFYTKKVMGRSGTGLGMAWKPTGKSSNSALVRGPLSPVAIRKPNVSKRRNGWARERI